MYASLVNESFLPKLTRNLCTCEVDWLHRVGQSWIQTNRNTNHSFLYSL